MSSAVQGTGVRARHAVPLRDRAANVGAGSRLCDRAHNVVARSRLARRACVLVLALAPWLAHAQTTADRVSPQPARQPDVNFVPTPREIADDMLALAGVRADDRVYDLGSGDGRLVLLAAQKYGAHGVGIELDPRLVAASRKAAVERGVSDRATFQTGDLFTADISAATVVTLYLSSRINEVLQPKLREELRPGTRIVSHMFRIGTWPPARTMRRDDGTELYLWIVPRRWKRAPDARFSPTPPRTVDAMLALARVAPEDVVYDLGSGDGRIPVLAAQKYGARAVGIEIDPALVDLARQVAGDGQVADRATFLEDDLFTADVAPATVVTLALPRALLDRLAPALSQTLRPGTRIVTKGTALAGWTPTATSRTADGIEIFLFTVK